MSYLDKLTELASSTEAKAVRIYELFKEGKISKTEAIATMTAMVSKANLRAASLADYSLAATLSLETGKAVPAIGITVQSGGTKAARAIKKILDTPTANADMLMRVKRFAHSEPLGAAARGSSKAIQAQPMVEGWVRGLDPDPCQLCQWWWRDGRVWPKNHRMPHHKGCMCIQIPTLSARNIIPLSGTVWRPPTRKKMGTI